jgi:hypothetical protein
LREVSKELAARGFLNGRGKPYAAKSVASMLRGVSKEIAARGFLNELGKPWRRPKGGQLTLRGSSELRRLTYHRHKHR